MDIPNFINSYNWDLVETLVTPAREAGYFDVGDLKSFNPFTKISSKVFM